MHIRPLASTDIPAVSRLLRELATRYILNESAPEGAATFLRENDEAGIADFIARGHVYHVAVSKGTLAGFVAVRGKRHLFHLFVGDKFKGQGLGRDLWSAARQAAIEAGGNGNFTVNSSNHAVGFYEKLGFVRTAPMQEAKGLKFNPMALTTRYVGSRQIRIVDASADLTFPAWVMYPTAVPSAPHAFGPYTANVSPGAPVVEGQFPVVVISHGGGGSHLLYRGLAAHLAVNGFIVAMPEHHGNNRNDNSLDGTMTNLANRPRHVSLTIDTLAADKQLAASVLPGAAALIGHSMGGYTALAAAGALPRDKDGTPVDVTADARVKALVLMAPATGWYLPEGRMDQVTMPILLYAAEHDEMTPVWNGELVINSVPDSGKVRYRLVENGGHYSFLAPFPQAMCNPSFKPSTDPEGFDRAAFHQRLNAEVLEFLEEIMKP